MRTDATHRLTGLILGVAALAASAGAAGAQPNRGLTPERVQRAAAIEDDPLEFHVVISTEPADRRRRGFLAAPRNDVHLRAVVERGTGAVAFEVRQTINYYDLQARDFRSVHYATPAGLERATVRRVRESVASCAASDAPTACHMLEEVSFRVEEPLLRRMAGAYRPDAAQPWRLRFKAAQGEDVDSAVTPAEIAGLLAALDDYRASLQRAGGASPQGQRGEQASGG